MTNLKKLVSEFQELNEAANATIAGDTRTRPSREIAKRQAQAQLPEKAREIAAEFKKVGFAVFVDAEKYDWYLKETRGVTEAMGVDLDSIFAPVYDSVHRVIGKRHREFNPTAFSLMMSMFLDLGKEAGVFDMEPLSFGGNVYLPSEVEVKKLVQSYIQRLEPSFLAAVVEHHVTPALQGMKLTSSVVPVIISGLPEYMYDSVGNKLFGGRFVVAVNSSGTTEDVVKTLKLIKSRKA